MIDRRNPEYIEGMEEFSDFALSGKENGVLLRCPRTYLFVMMGLQCRSI